MSDAGDPLPDCRNCGEPLGGAFCAACGQRARDLDVPFRQLVREFLTTVLAFDSRLLRTLGPLLARPGLLTVEYNAGRRVRYVPPLTLYVFISFVLFLTLALAGRSVVVTVSEDAERTQGSVRVWVTESEEPTPAGDDPPGEGRPGALEALFGRAIEILEEEPERFDAVLRNHLARALFVLVPVFALLLRLFYRRGGFYVRHLVLALHLHCFAFLAIAAAVAVDTLLPTDDVVLKLVQLVILVHVFLALRRVYGESRRRTAIKYVGLWLGYVLLLLPTMFATLLATGLSL